MRFYGYLTFWKHCPFINNMEKRQVCGPAVFLWFRSLGIIIENQAIFRQSEFHFIRMYVSAW